jgi:phytoene/squalene synthetase
MTTNLAAAITKAASKQTYYTILFLVDRSRVDDAFRAYGYFRWVDNILDADSGSELERKSFLARQKALLDSCYRGEPHKDATIQERMLIELVGHDQEKNSGLQSYLRNMMMVMEFDAMRRGRLISQAELHEYMRWLAIAVTEAMQYFIGNGEIAPRDETSTLAVFAAHIIHMLRDTYEDMQAGYFNIPREVLEANAIGPRDVDSRAYRAWVRSRLELARKQFEMGRSFLERVQNLRYRLAGYAYMARFEWLLAKIEREGYKLHSQYNERKSLETGLRMSWFILSSVIGLRGLGAGAPSLPSQQQSKG